MIQFEKFQLDNGIKVLVHQDNSTPMAVVNVLYNVGAKDEDPNKTGFAHLFEHLMFGGSVNIPVYDEPLQRAGGENNAYTTNDLTNYYCQIPAENIETEPVPVKYEPEPEVYDRTIKSEVLDEDSLVEHEPHPYSLKYEPEPELVKFKPDFVQLRNEPEPECDDYEN